MSHVSQKKLKSSKLNIVLHKENISLTLLENLVNFFGIRSMTTSLNI